MQSTIIGAGLAGCEAALWLADAGVQVHLYEQKPAKFSPAHKSEGFAELICSNSLKAERPDSASGLLKIEMRKMGRHLLRAAETARVAVGGALAVDRDVFSAAVTDEFIKHGGTVKLNTAVEKILVEDSAVKGVRCTNGEEYYADTVLTNCNKILTYIDMIDEQYVPEQVFDDLRVSVPSQSIFVVYLGLDCTAEEAGIVNETSFCRAVSDPTKMFANRFDVNVRTDHLSSVEISCYNVDYPEASPEGTCIVSVLASKMPDWFVNCPPEEYFERKDEYLARMLDFVYDYYPGIKGHIEEIECATPLTLMRYLGSLNGGVYGMDAHMKDLIANKLEMGSPIKGLYFCGASVFVGGFNNAMASGYYAARRIFHDEAKEG